MAPLALACVAVAPVASAQSYAPWLTQIGLTASIASAANWGQNQMIGIVDTGIAAGNIAFAAGQVSATQSACAAVTFRCTNGVADDNGHGTAVAAIAAGNRRWTTTNTYGGYTVVANSFVGVAPNANIVAEKVLAANGSGTNLDVVNGINRAAAAGASVINLSLTYMNSPDIVAAINNATAKGAFIVWAGGNSAANLLANANTNGLTQNAINHLLFAGSVNSANNLSSFSHKINPAVLGLKLKIQMAHIVLKHLL
jgi:subtilisin family serine protease